MAIANRKSEDLQEEKKQKLAALTVKLTEQENELTGKDQAIAELSRELEQLKANYHDQDAELSKLKISLAQDGDIQAEMAKLHEATSTMLKQTQVKFAELDKSYQSSEHEKQVLKDETENLKKELEEKN